MYVLYFKLIYIYVFFFLALTGNSILYGTVGCVSKRSSSSSCVEEMFRSISLPLRSTTTALYCHTALTVYMVGIF